MRKKVVSVSGGADSTALALLLWERGEDFEMLFADTGAELPEVYWLLPRLARKVGKKLHVVSGQGMFHFLARWGYLLPSNMGRWCTRELKIKPMNLWHDSNDTEVVHIGIRADEKESRLHNQYVDYCENSYPLREAGYGKADVKALCKKYDLLNPVYQWRSSVSCFCCFNQKKFDWKGLYKYHPELYMISEQWEKESQLNSKGFGWMSGYSLEQLRKADESQIKLFPETEVAPCLICTL